MEITHDQILRFGFVMTAMFDSLYPRGTTLEQMKIDSEAHGWLRSIIPSLSVIEEVGIATDVSGVGM